MISLINLAVLFAAKVADNALSTTKTILVQRSRWILAGIAGGADIILLPEMPYNFDAVLMAVKQRNKAGKRFSILATWGVLKKKVLMKKKKEQDRMWYLNMDI